MHANKGSCNQQVLVVGAGVCGSVIARSLRARGVKVTICDKGRGAGGRLSSRRSPAGPFNHGAPHFIVREPSQLPEVGQWLRAGLVDLEDQEHGTLVRPRGPMNALVKLLHKELEVMFNTRVVGLSRSGGLWRADTESDPLSAFGHVVLTLPVPQTKALLPKMSPLAAVLEPIVYAPAWVVMVSAEAAEVVGCGHPLVGQIETMESGVCVHLTREASERYVEATGDEVLTALGLDSNVANYVSAHRWRYSQVEAFTSVRFSTDEYTNLTVCGDGFGGAGVESAMLSGKAVAQHLFEKLSLD